MYTSYSAWNYFLKQSGSFLHCFSEINTRTYINLAFRSHNKRHNLLFLFMYFLRGPSTTYPQQKSFDIHGATGRVSILQYQREVRPCPCTLLHMGMAERNAMDQILKIIYAPVFIDLKYIHGFQNSASIMKQKTDTVSGIPDQRYFLFPSVAGLYLPNLQVLCQSSEPHRLCVCTGRQCMCKQADCCTGRGFSVLQITMCREGNFHCNIKKKGRRPAVRTLATLPYCKCISRIPINGCLVSAYSRSPFAETANVNNSESYLWYWPWQG